MTVDSMPEPEKSTWWAVLGGPIEGMGVYKDQRYVIQICPIASES